MINHEKGLGRLNCLFRRMTEEVIFYLGVKEKRPFYLKGPPN